MSPEEIQKIVEYTIQRENYWVYILVSVVLSLIAVFIFQYFTEKAKNYATKQDIEEITNKIEEIKAKIQSNQEITKQKRELKYNGREITN